MSFLSSLYRLRLDDLFSERFSTPTSLHYVFLEFILILGREDIVSMKSPHSVHTTVKLFEQVLMFVSMFLLSFAKFQQAKTYSIVLK